MRPEPAGGAVTSKWDLFWFSEIAPHVYSVLRILFGLLGCASLVGLLDLPLFWSCQGLVASRGGLLCQSVGDLYPHAILAVSAVSFLAMAAGYQTRLAVACAFGSVFVMANWNDLPLSAAHQLLRAILFCLLWADCGRTWSVDAWLSRRRVSSDARTCRVPVWPLRLVQIQIAAVYPVTSLWKLNNVMWRDGTALHYVFENPQFRRFAVLASPSWDSWTTAATYATLFWELSFAFLVFYPRTRRWVLAVSVLMHLGVWATLEVGPFSWVMLAGYVAFLDTWEAVKAIKTTATGT
jgi:Vitamin K-dependent gamma-carboxylase